MSWRAQAADQGWPVAPEALPRAIRDPEAERWTCAAAMVAVVYSDDLLGQMLTLVSSEDFFDSQWRDTWRAIERISATAGTAAVNQLTVAREMDRAKAYRPGVTWVELSEAIIELPTGLVGPQAARMVRECAEHRRALAVAQGMAQRASSGEQGFNEEGLQWGNLD